MPDDVQRWRGLLLNDHGYHALHDGRIDEALLLFDRSVDACRRAEDWDGEVMALENKYLALRQAQRYRDALRTYRDVFDALFRARSYRKVGHYWLEVTRALATLDELGDVVVSREQYRDDDVRRAVEERGLDDVRDAGVLVVGETDDVIEVMANLPVAERLAFLDQITEAIRTQMDALGIQSLSELAES